MKIQTRDNGSVTILRLEGDLVVGDPETIFLNTVSELAQEGRVKLLVDLGGIRYLDSSGVDALLRALTIATEKEGTTKLLHPHERTLKMLEITHLNSVFEIFDDESKAISSF